MRLLISLALILITSPALAQLNRSFVSTTGSDANPCTPAAPCRSFAAAIAQTNSAGETVALDSGGYGPFTVDREITILAAPGVHAAVTATSGTAATIQAGATDAVTIRGLALAGRGASVGFESLTAGELTLRNCEISGFTSGALLTHGGYAYVADTVARNNDIVGISFNPKDGNQLQGSVTDTKVFGSNTGFRVLAGAFVAMRNIVSSGNEGNYGVQVSNSSDVVSAIAVISDSLLSSNRIGLAVQHLNGNEIQPARATISNVTITGNSVQGIFVFGAGASIVSYGNNQITENPSNGVPTMTIPRD